MLKHAALVFGLSVAIALSACGGGSGGPPPATSVYVRTSGSDTNNGAGPATALKTIARAVQLAPSGSRIIVGPGTYKEGVAIASVLAFFADTSGAFTQDSPGAVVIDLSGLQEPGFELSNSKGGLIDGFTIKDAAGAGIALKGGSDNSIIQDCTISHTVGDGIRVEASINVLVFNNLVYDSTGTGIGVGAASVGSANAKIISNTIFGNSSGGITVGDAAPKPASPGTLIRNNIIQSNGGDASIEVFAGSYADYNEDFDLVMPATFLPVSPDLSGKHDFRDVDAQFVNPTKDDGFLLSSNSPAIDKGDTSDLVHKTMTVDSNGQPISVSVFLKGRTTTGGTACDLGAPDLGFHYPVTGRCTAGGA